MSNKVRISVLSTSHLMEVKYSGEVRNMESNFGRMTSFLQGELEKVFSDKPDLILLPEACDRFPSIPDSRQNDWYRFRGNRILNFLCDVARKNNCFIAYPAIRFIPSETELPFRNSVQLIGRDGKVIGVYDKNHLVPLELDDRGISYGKDAPVFQLDFGNVACLICFDLNFTALLKNYAIKKPKLLLFSSYFHGGILQQEWAYHCRSYFAGAIYNDQSRIITPFGTEVAATTNYHDFETADIDLDYEIVHLDRNVEKIIAARKKYGHALDVFDPGHIGSVMLTYRESDRTALDIVQEFDMILLDDYLELCNRHRQFNLKARTFHV